jgi:glycosyltransferase involved in cell wall biosynthesis
MPSGFLSALSFRGRMSEAIRNLGSRLIALDPLMHSTFRRAQLIACTTAETVARIPRRYRAKCVVQLAIGIDEAEISAAPSAPPAPPRLLFVGRLLYWKGLHLAFRALAEARSSVPDLKMKIIGSGEDRVWLERKARGAGVTDLLEWVSSTPHEQIVREYHHSLCLVFPSLHDSGGMVVLEALAAGLPVICLDLGGPGTIATPNCALIVPTHRSAQADVERGLADAIIRLVRDDQLGARLSANATQRARELTWDRAAENLYSRAESVFRK